MPVSASGKYRYLLTSLYNIAWSINYQYINLICHRTFLVAQVTSTLEVTSQQAQNLET
jgi:hypothetical protein